MSSKDMGQYVCGKLEVALSLGRRVILAVLQLSGMTSLESITLSCSTIFIEAFSSSSLSISKVSPDGPMAL